MSVPADFRRRSPALSILDEFDAGLARTGASASTRRQRRWALVEAVKFTAETTGVPVDAVTIETLLRPDIASGWLTSAATGNMHSRGPHRQSSRAALRARLATIRAVADHLDLLAPDITVPTVATAPRLSEAEARAAIRSLLGGPPPRMQRATWARTASLAALVVDTGERLGALVPVTVDEVGPSVTVLDRAGDRVALSPETRSVLISWLAERATLVQRLEGTAPPQLWVTTRTVTIGSGRDARLHPAGLPLTERALHQSHRRALQRLVLSGAHVDLLRLGQLRPGT